MALLAGQSLYWGGSFGGWFFFGFLFWLLPLFAVIVLISLTVRWLLRPRASQGSLTGNSNALAILEERYAKGDITAEQFAQMKKELRR